MLSSTRASPGRNRRAGSCNAPPALPRRGN
jgi:hypothetical protein